MWILTVIPFRVIPVVIQTSPTNSSISSTLHETNYLSILYITMSLIHQFHTSGASGNIRLVDSRPGQSPYDERDQIVVIICSLVHLVWMQLKVGTKFEQRTTRRPAAGDSPNISSANMSGDCATCRAGNASQNRPFETFSQLNDKMRTLPSQQLQVVPRPHLRRRTYRLLALGPLRWSEQQNQQQHQHVQPRNH